MIFSKIKEYGYLIVDLTYFILSFGSFGFLLRLLIDPLKGELNFFPFIAYIGLVTSIWLLTIFWRIFVKKEKIIQFGIFGREFAYFYISSAFLFWLLIFISVNPWFKPNFFYSFLKLIDLNWAAKDLEVVILTVPLGFLFIVAPFLLSIIVVYTICLKLLPGLSKESKKINNGVISSVLGILIVLGACLVFFFMFFIIIYIRNTLTSEQPWLMEKLTQIYEQLVYIALGTPAFYYGRILLFGYEAISKKYKYM